MKNSRKWSTSASRPVKWRNCMGSVALAMLLAVHSPFQVLADEQGPTVFVENLGENASDPAGESTDTSVPADTAEQVNSISEGETEEAPALQSIAPESEEEVQKEPAIAVMDTDGTERVIRVTYENYQPKNSADQPIVAVWSKENGQDDLKWYNLKPDKASQSYCVDIPLSNHKANGGLFLHGYVNEYPGKMVFFAGTEFEAHPVTAEKLEITDVNPNKGTALVTLSGVSCPSGVKKVAFPVWSASDQSDIVWYSATEISDGIYQATVDRAKHKGHNGTYQVHTYGTNGNGAMNFLLRSTFLMTEGETSLEVEKSDNGYMINADHMNTSSGDTVKIAIWSKANGQDDLKWLTASPSSTGSASISWNPAETGDYFIHCYVYTKNRQMVFRKGITYTVQGAVPGELELTSDSNSGDFTIELKNISAPYKIQQVLFPVWNDPNQKDIIWYNAVKQAEGSYKVSSNIAKHSYRTGTYQVHIYLKDSSGGMHFLQRDQFSIEAPAGNLFVENAGTGRRTVTIAGLSGNVKKVMFPTWSITGGQDDIVWYSGRKVADGVWSATVASENLKHAGEVVTHCYVDNNVFSGQARMTFDESEMQPAKSTISFNTGWEFGSFSMIHSGSSVLYRASGNRKNIVVGVNAGHGTAGGTKVKTYCHPDKSPKVTGGSTAAGAVTATAVSTGMNFLDGTPEASVTLQEAQILKNLLLAEGYDVLMVRDGADVQLDNVARTVLCNNVADCHIAIHWDGDGLSYDKGCFYTSVPAALRSMYPVSQHWQQHNQLGSCLINGLASVGCKLFESGHMDMDLTQTSYSTIPSTDLELGNAASNHSQATLEKLAKGIVAGLNQYFG